MSALATMEAFEKLLNESLDSSTPKEGEVVKSYSMVTSPKGEKLISMIDKLLAE